MPRHLDEFLSDIRNLSYDDALNIFRSGNSIPSNTEPSLEGLKVSGTWQNAAGVWLRSFKAEKGGSDEINKDEILRELEKYTPKKVKLKSHNKKLETLYVFSIPDIHFGKESIKVTRDKINFVVSDLLSRVTTKNNKFVFVVGNDLLNSDTVGYTTSKGTPQFEVEDWKDSFNAAWKSMIEITETLIELGTVDIINIAGNHDLVKGYTIGSILEAYYHKNENVTVNNIKEERKYYEYGKLLLGFDHGEIRKSQDYESLMATEKPEMWGRTKHRNWFLGHLHHEMRKQYRSVTVTYLSSICKTDAWHRKNGFVNNNKFAQMFEFDIELGLRTTYQVSL